MIVVHPHPITLTHKYCFRRYGGGFTVVTARLVNARGEEACGEMGVTVDGWGFRKIGRDALDRIDGSPLYKTDRCRELGTVSRHMSSPKKSNGELAHK